MAVKKVTIIGPAFPLRGGGITSFNERMAKEFVALGYETKVLTFSLQYPSFLFPGKSQYADRPAPEGLDIEPVINSINPFNWIRVGMKLRKMKSDLIVVRYWLPFMGPCLGTILRFVPKRSKTRIVCIVDNIIPHEKRPGDTLFTKYFLGPVHRFITLSNTVEKDLKLFTNKPIQVVTHPLYDQFGGRLDGISARAKLGISSTSKVFLFFGFIRKYKGLELLLNAFDSLYVKHNDIRLIVAGEIYEDEAEITALYERLHSKDSILWHTHFIEDNEIATYFSSSDVVVQPYVHATQSGVTPIAYHFEVPMIVTNVGGLPEFVPNTVGIVVEPNAEAIERGMQEMMTKDLKLMGLQIREEKKKYSWTRLIDALIEEPIDKV